MGFKISAEYAGDDRVELTHGLSGDKMFTDLPPDNGGRGRTFSPTDLAAASVASCVLTIMAKIAERNGIDFKGSSFEIEKHMQENPRRIARLTGVITLPPELDPVQREKLLAAVRACPVSRSLHPDIALEFEYR
ncbi:MAG: osmotically inducible protein OsmC [Elusimicrobia bacterium HGW-Elusimicrobia-3]|nr:MAG: osmotically inducible protein OsmC [Elusimicrobia bacterium HGW-Elusimicrobia-3]